MTEFEPTSWVVAAIGFVVLVPLLLVAWGRSKRRTGAVRVSTLRSFAGGHPPLRQRLRVLVPALRVLALALLFVGLARPRQGDEVTEVTTRGIAIQLVVDRSSSMWENVMRYDNDVLPRLEVVKRIVKRFVLGDDDLEGRGNDMIGLTTFARYAEEECPLTLDHANFVEFIDSLTYAEGDSGNATNISDALYQAVLSLVVADDYVRETVGREDEYRIASKIIVLLTDGEQTRRIAQHTFQESAEIAKKNDITIHTIAITSGADRRRGSFFLPIGKLDTSAIEGVARATGGMFEQATDGDSLEEIYGEIDRLEKSDFRQTFRRYDERFAWPVAAALVALALEVLLACTWLRRIP